LVTLILTLAAGLAFVTTAHAQTADPQPIGMVWDGRITGNSLGNNVPVHCPGESTQVTPMQDSTGWFARARVDGPGLCLGSKTWRAEMKAPATSPPGDIPRGKVWYFSEEMRFPSGFPSLTEPGSFCNAWQLFGGFTGEHRTGGPKTGIWCHEPGAPTQYLSVIGPGDDQWRGSLAKGQGWHGLVMRVVFQPSAADGGHVTLWHRAPGAANYSKVVSAAGQTWVPSTDTGLMHLQYGYYRGVNDPVGRNPWIDHTGIAVSDCHEVDPACTGDPEPPPPPPTGDSAPDITAINCSPCNPAANQPMTLTAVGSDGTVNSIGGNAPLDFVWTRFNGSTSTGTQTGNPTTWTSPNTTPKTYRVTVTDADGDTDTYTSPRRLGGSTTSASPVAHSMPAMYGEPGAFFFHYTKSGTAFGAILRGDESPQLRLSPYRLMDDPVESKDWGVAQMVERPVQPGDGSRR
jgi:hypothetical protein